MRANSKQRPGAAARLVTSFLLLGVAAVASACGLLIWTYGSYEQPVAFSHRLHIDEVGVECSDCHLTANYKEFACIECHAHNRTNMNNKHSGVTGYVYASANCYACHPDGQE